MSQTNVVEVRSLSVTRGRVRAVVDASLDLPSGSITGLLGPSGSGKTTLMRSLVGSQIIDDGSISILGNPAGTAAIRSDIGYMSQMPALYADLTVGENLAYFGRVLNVASQRVGEVVAQVEITQGVPSWMPSLVAALTRPAATSAGAASEAFRKLRRSVMLFSVFLLLRPKSKQSRRSGTVPPPMPICRPNSPRSLS